MPSKPFYEIGPHVGEVISQALAEAGTGTAQFVLRVKILGTPTNDGSYESHKTQYERTLYMALTEKTMSWVAPALVQLGFKGTQVSQLDPSHPQHQSFVGDQVDLWCGHREDNKGGWRENWNISNQTERERTPLDAKKTRQLDSLFGKALKQSGAAPATPPPTATRQNNPEISDDDIPF